MLHHILQWHKMLSSVKPRTDVGSMLAGWGLFNVVEGIIDHEILGIHHVHPGGGQLGWDIGFLVFGALALALGGWAIRAGRGDVTPRAGLLAA